MSYFSGKRDPKPAARDAIVSLRQQLIMLEKKEKHLNDQIEGERTKAKENVLKNKPAAAQALKRVKMHEQDLGRISGQRMQLEIQINTIESANLNAETMLAMKKGAEALKAIHGNTNIEQVDATMEAIHEQRAIATEISDAISSPMGAGLEYDEDELAAQLESMESEALSDALTGAGRAPIHSPAGPSRVAEPTPMEEEAEEEAELKALQAALAM